ncbi:hypothetical protein ACFVT2_24915 [Streptomyces sp. NPDC058000]|uniref:hypothetical protein n=1 Tax=Streptomyces sp. NPDC058000 TaxID=3346299 RepID=UPI0036DFA5FD
MGAHAEGQTEVFLLDAGVSVERLAKATLVRVHPTLLSEVKGNDDMLLHFAEGRRCGEGAHRAVPARGATGATARAGRRPD